MKYLSRLFLIGLTAVLSLAVLLPGAHVLAQGPVDEENEETNDPSRPMLAPLPELEHGNDLFGETPVVAIPSQGELHMDLEFETSIPQLFNGPGGNDPSAGTLFESPPANLPSTGNHPVPDAPVSDSRLDDLVSSLEPQVKAALGAVADQLLERLKGWLHEEADLVSESFNRWLHQEVDRLLESLKTWLAEQLSDMEGQEGIELEPLKG